MHILCLNPDINQDSYDKNKTKRCYFCDSKQINYESYYENMILNTCFLCHMTINYQKDHLFYGFLAKSNLSQIEIIKKTWEHYNKTETIPFASDIDPNVKLVKLNPYVYSQIKNNDIKNIKLFFTSRITEIIEDDYDAVFNPSKKLNKNYEEYYNLPQYYFSEDMDDLIRNRISRLKDNHKTLYNNKEQFEKKLSLLS